MKALIDADIFQWEFGSATDDEGHPLSWPLVQARIQGRIDQIVEATGADSYQLYITSDDKSNFRYQVATIQPYKGNRVDIEKPRWYNQIRNFLVDRRGAIEVHGMEADDAISIEQCKDLTKSKALLQYQNNDYDTLKIWTEYGQTVICSRDKDLNMVPGYHYSWACGKQKEKPIWWQNELEGLKCFYKQLLTGDTVDNILGLFGVGKSSSLLTYVDSCSDEYACYDYVLSQYSKRFGSYADQFLVENARLLWMLQEEGQVWEPPQRKETSSEEEDNQEE